MFIRRFAVIFERGRVSSGWFLRKKHYLSINNADLFTSDNFHLWILFLFSFTEGIFCFSLLKAFLSFFMKVTYGKSFVPNEVKKSKENGWFMEIGEISRDKSEKKGWSAKNDNLLKISKNQYWKAKNKWKFRPNFFTKFSTKNLPSNSNSNSPNPLISRQLSGKSSQPLPFPNAVASFPLLATHVCHVIIIIWKTFLAINSAVAWWIMSWMSSLRRTAFFPFYSCIWKILNSLGEQRCKERIREKICVLKFFLPPAVARWF